MHIARALVARLLRSITVIEQRKEQPLLRGGPPSPRSHGKKQAKRARDRSAANSADSDVFEEYAAIVAQEIARQPPAPPEQPLESTKPGRRTGGRGDVNHGATAKGSASTAEPRVRIHLGFHEPHDPRPANAIFVLREGYSEIGFEHDPKFSTTTLRSLLLGLHNKDYRRTRSRA